MDVKEKILALLFFISFVKFIIWPGYYTYAMRSGGIHNVIGSYFNVGNHMNMTSIDTVVIADADDISREVKVKYKVRL